MKRTIQLLFAASVLLIGVPSFAQDAKTSDTTKTIDATQTTKTASVAAGKSADMTYDGSKFKVLRLNMLGEDGQLFNYKLLRGSEILSSGHTTGVIEIKSDGKSTYTLQLSNPTKKTLNAKVVSADGTGGK